MQPKIWLVLALLILAVPLSGNSPLGLRVTPEMAFEPARVNIHVRIEPNPDNRAVEIVAESDAFYRSSRIDVDGDRAPRMTLFQYRDLPAGEYEVRATLIGPDGRERAVERHQLSVFR